MTTDEWMNNAVASWQREFPNTTEGYLFAIYDPNWWERIVLWVLLRLGRWAR